MEIEGKDVDSIHKILESMGLFIDNAEKEHYGELLDRKMVELGLSPRTNLNATFEEYKNWEAMEAVEGRIKSNSLNWPPGL
ncbi:MAG: hypothetical protein ABIE43_05315 [Patescibacteria group bacterium]